MNSKVTQARTLMKQISVNLDRFPSRSSLYLTDCKHSIHWVSSNFPNDPGGGGQDDRASENMDFEYSAFVGSRIS